AAYITVFILLIAVLFTRPINGARSWLGIGTFGIQPSEFAKLTTALILAYIIDQGRGNFISTEKFYKSIGIVALTMFMVLIQNDTGTFLLFTAYFFVMYREGITFDPIILFFTNRIFGFRFKQT